MNPIRIIPRLDIKGPNLVKGIHLEGLRVLGNPQRFAKYYYENGADEIMYQDVVASLYDRNSLTDLISETAKSISIPLTVGGGLRSIEDINAVLRAGADRVSLNTAAINNPEMIKEAVNKFGASTISVAIEAIRQENGDYLAYTDNGREHTGLEVTSWAKKVAEFGVGEIFLTSVDKEGTGYGFDQELIKKVSSIVSIPVVAHGGCSGPQDALDSIVASGANAICAASVFHYKFLEENKFEEDISPNSSEGNTTFVKSGRSTFNRISPCSLQEMKAHFQEHNQDVRH